MSMQIEQTYFLHRTNFADRVMKRLGKEKPKIMVLYGKHHPAEPFSEIVNTLRSGFQPEQVIFVEFPPNHTPLGEALENYEFLISLRQNIAEGRIILGDSISAKEQEEFCRLLAEMIERIEKHKDDITQRHESGFLELQGTARRLVCEIINELNQSPLESAKIDFNKLMNELRSLVTPVPNEELVVQELSRSLSGVHFVSLHGGFPRLATNYLFRDPFKEVYATKAAYKYHSQVVNELKDIETSWWWGIKPDRTDDDLKGLDFHYFEERVSYALLELPLGDDSPFHLDRYTSAIPQDELIRAIIGAYFFPSPGREQEPYPFDMDYFRATVLTDEIRQSLFDNIAKYLELLLNIGVSTRLV